MAGLTQVELAKLSGVSAFTITEIETGQREPRASTLRKLAAALGVEVADFFREPSSPKVPSRPSPELPSSGDEGRRALYLATVLEEARDLTRQALWMRNFEHYGDNPAELTGWSWKINDFLSSVWAQQQRWENHVFGPLEEQELPEWERNLLEQIKEAIESAENAGSQARSRLGEHIEIRELGKQVAQWREESEQTRA